MKRFALFLLASALPVMSACSTGESSAAMKNLQARIDVVLCLRNIVEQEEVQRSDLDELTLYAPQVITDDRLRQTFLDLKDRLWENRKAATKIEEIAREMAKCIALPAKYADAYAF